MNKRTYMNQRELAKYFGVSPLKIKEWVTKGCPCVNPALKSQFEFRQHLLFKVSDVERWLNSFTQPEPEITQLYFDLH